MAPRATEAWTKVAVWNGSLTVREAAGSTDSDLWAFRRLTGTNRPDQLDNNTYQRYQALAAWLYYQNPLARRLCDAPTDMIVGSGITIDTEKTKLENDAAEDIKKLIERFLEHPANQFNHRLSGHFTCLNAVNGELFLPVFVSPENGDLALGFLEHNLVLDVLFNPLNRMEAVAVIQVPPGTGDKKIWWNVVRAQQGQDNPSYPPHPSIGGDMQMATAAVPINTELSIHGFQSDSFTYGGELLYFSANKIGSGRGRTALEPALDWLHAYDNFLFGDLRNANLQASFVWDVEITGANLPELISKREEIRKNPPRPGEVNIHNEKEKWQALSPNLNAASHSELGSQVKRVIGLAMGLPSHLIGAEEKVNRTTSVSSDIPFLRRMESRQALLKFVVQTILDYQLDQKVHVGVLTAERPYPYRIVTPSLTAAEILGQAEAIYNITQSVLDMTARGGITMSEARRVWYSYGLMEDNVPTNMDAQIKAEIAAGILPDPSLIAGTNEDPSKKAPGAPGGDAGRVKRAKTVTGR